MKCVLEDLPSIKDFGAVGDDVADDTSAIQAAVDAGMSYAPIGTYKINDTILIPEYSGLVGLHREKCIINADNVAGPTIDTVSNDHHQDIRNISIIGNAHTGLRINTSAQVNVDNVAIRSGSFQDGFVFNKSFGSYLTNLSTNGANISENCFYTGSDFNANHCSAWYTSNFSDVNILIDGGHGSVFDMMTCQGGRVGLYIRSGVHHVFNGFYSENVVLPILIGEKNGPLINAISLNGGSVGGPNLSHPSYAERAAHIHIVYARGVAIKAMSLSGYGSGDQPLLDGIYYGDCSNISIDAIYTPGLPTGGHWKVIKRMLGHDSTGSDIRLSTAGDQSAAQFMMKGPNFNWSYFLIELDINGNFVPTAHTPDYAISPPLGVSDLSEHQDNKNYIVDQFVFVGPPIDGSDVYLCVTGGTSGVGTAPAGNQSGQSDGSVVWDHYGLML